MHQPATKKKQLTNSAKTQVPHNVAATSESRECTLLETIKSLYDQKLRTTRLLIPSSSTQKCRQQLDWPFEFGTMRDGMPMLGKNDVSQPCNVLERIPPFKYRYFPRPQMKVVMQSHLTFLQINNVCMCIVPPTKE